MKTPTKLLLTLAFLVASNLIFAQDKPQGLDAQITKDNVMDVNKPYSPYANKAYPKNVYFGDTHLHTEQSPDAYLFGVRLTPDDAFRFAKGEQIQSTFGLPIKLIRPLDFLVVADHSEYLGLMPKLFNGDPQVLSTEYGREVYDLAQSGDDGPFKAAMLVINDISNNDEKMKAPDLEQGVWNKVTETADKHNQPGNFTAFIGYEWTSLISGNNLHRVVIFKDGANKASQVVPFSSFDSPDPEDLWNYMEGYEKKTGGNILAIPHNGNLSNAMMFQTDRLNGKGPFTKDYAETRIKWEPLYEITQIKGDGESHPFLSPNDEYADYENWDFANLNGSQMKEDWMLQYEYGRSALKLGLKLEKELGINPYKFGVIGSTDAHTGLVTTREDNFFGKHSGTEPDPHRLDHVVGEFGDFKVMSWQMVASGLAAVWAQENTRESIFEAMERKETYATTGSRMLVRVFGGYDFKADEVERPDFVEQGYTRGVPMGGDLRQADRGQKPSFMVRALRDPAGGNLDRVQIIKGWLDKDGELHEKIYDVAVSDGRTIGSDGRCKQDVGNTVDVANASYTNSIGDAILMGYWQDPDFDPSLKSFYYVRVISIPIPRWTAFDVKRYNIKDVPEEIPMITTERAYTSPIWYTPN